LKCPPVVRDWSIRYVRDGFVYVRGHGDVYQAQIGAPLPGLGSVQEIKRGADVQGRNRVHAGPPLFRAVLTVAFRPENVAPAAGAAFLCTEPCA
jgi:hypothetical protein